MESVAIRPDSGRGLSNPKGLGNAEDALGGETHFKDSTENAEISFAAILGANVADFGGEVGAALNPTEFLND